MAIELVLFFAFIAFVSIQILYYLNFLFSFSIKRADVKLKKNIPVSVIICAKNESENLKSNLPFILNQEYSNFELVLVNDSSYDDTLEVMKSFASKHKNIKLVDVKTIETFWGNKKYALTLGIKASTNDFLVFTDADCKPNSNKWLSHISSNFSNQKSIVLGYGAYEKRSYSFLNKLIRFETLMTALQYFSFTNLGLPYMGVGRNMAYRKELFFNNAGFQNHMHLKSGDDDLFVNEVATKSNTALCFTKESFTVSKPKETFKDWFLQKRRHVSTAKYYKWSHKILLGLFYASQLMFWVLAGILLSIGYQLFWVVILIGLRFFIQLLSVGFSSKKLGENDLILLGPFLELFLIPIQLSIFIANLLSKPKHWK
jgi:glycosyltransferase involved in cell wall biosynthesis